MTIAEHLKIVTGPSTGLSRDWHLRKSIASKAFCASLGEVDDFTIKMENVFALNKVPYLMNLDENLLFGLAFAGATVTHFG